MRLSSFCILAVLLVFPATSLAAAPSSGPPNPSPSSGRQRTKSAARRLYHVAKRKIHETFADEAEEEEHEKIKNSNKKGIHKALNTFSDSDSVLPHALHDTAPFDTSAIQHSATQFATDLGSELAEQALADLENTETPSPHSLFHRVKAKAKEFLPGGESGEEMKLSSSDSNSASDRDHTVEETQGYVSRMMSGVQNWWAGSDGEKKEENALMPQEIVDPMTELQKAHAQLSEMIQEEEQEENGSVKLRSAKRAGKWTPKYIVLCVGISLGLVLLLATVAISGYNRYKLAHRPVSALERSLCGSSSLARSRAVRKNPCYTYF